MSLAEKEEDREKRVGRLWGTPDPSIWSGDSSPKSWTARVGLKIIDAIRSFPAVFLAPLFGFFVPLSFLVGYYLAGPTFLGPVLVSLWVLFLVSFVLVAERTGHARHYEAWDIPLRRILFIPIGFVFSVGLLFLLLLLAHHVP